MGLFTDTENQTSRSVPWKPQRRYLKKGFKEAWQLYKKGGPKYYKGQQVADFSAEQNQAFNKGKSRALKGNQTVNMGEGFTQDVLSGKYAGDPYESGVYKQIESRVLPSVNSMFSAGGRYGSNAHQDAGATALNREFAPYAAQMYQQGLDRMDGAAERGFEYGQDDYRDLSALEGIGQKRQLQRQANIDARKAKWDFNQQRPYTNLQNFNQNIQGNYGGSTMTPVTSPSMFSQVLGVGATALGAFLSDARFKKNIRRVGAMDNGTPIYAYEYKGDNKTQFGVMAQEVEKTYPDAVVTDANGVRFVNYSVLAAK